MNKIFLILYIVALVCIISLASAVETGELADTPWPKFQANLHNTGQSPYNGPQTNNTIWTYVAGMYYGSAVIGSDGTIYVGSSNNKIYALNPDGTLKWTYTTGGKIYGSAAIGSDGTVYVGSYDKNLYALNSDGTLKWTYKTSATICTSPTIGSDGTVYIGNSNANLYALNPDGTLKWSNTTGNSYSYYGSPAIGSDGIIYVGSQTGSVYALNSDGTLKWSYSTGPVRGSTIGSDGTIYVGSQDKNIYALNSDGTLKWSYTTGGYVYSSPAIGSDGTIYIGSNDKNLYALNPNGTLKWRYTTEGNIFGSAAIGSDGTIYVGSSDKNVYALNPDGTLKWICTAGGSFSYNSPSIAVDGTLYIGNYGDQKLYAFKDVAPVANFTSKIESGTKGYVPLTVQFTDTSLHIPTTWLWDFGDGTTSTEQNPLHTYTVPGTYSVNLTVTNAAGSNTTVKTDYLTLIPLSASPVANFTATPTSGEIPLTVQFTDLSTGIVSSWAWDFDNDGTIDSTLQNPSYTYYAAGNYTVNLTVTNGAGSDDEIRTDYITVATIAAPVANFTATPTSGSAPLTVQFNDTSTGSINSYAWDFNNDGTIDSTNTNASYTYSSAGMYTINYTVTGYGGSSSAVRTDLITVTGESDLTVLSLSNLYPNSHTVTATIKNQGTQDADSFKVNFTVDGNSTVIDVPGLAAGSTTILSVTDPVSRKYGDPVPISITLDTENAIAETDETNNIYNTTTTVNTNGNYYTGGRYYSGNDLETGAYVEGNVAVIYSLGDSGYQSGGMWYSTTVYWTDNDLPIPANATVKEARLYQSYTWCANGNPDFTVQINGNTVEQAAFYTDPMKDGDGAISGFNGQAIYDVTPYFNSSGNTALITASKPNGGLYGAVLVVIYEDASEPYRMIWLAEGCDTLYGGTDDYYIAYAMFNNVTRDNLISAKTTTILPSGADNSQSTILFNGQRIPIKGSGGSDPGFKWYDVTSALQNGTNEVGVRNDGGYLNLASAILEVTKDTASEANFIANVTSGNAPLKVKFTDTSTGTPTNWTWDFGDGSTSTDQNPTHIYTAEGTYTVKLTVSNSLGSDSEEKTGYISVGSVVLAPVADFSADPTSGNAPFTVQFKDESANTPTSWEWDFGDSKTSTEQNPSHTYETMGTYTVKLTVTNYGGSNTTIKTDYITVTSDVSAPVASFTTDANSGQVPLTVHFTDTSAGKVSSWNWDFGDGETSTKQNPTHTYVTAGSYKITLTAKGPGGSNTAASAESITVSAPLTSPSYNGGIPLTTAQNGTVSGGLWYDSYPGFSTSAQKTFTLPDYTKIKWARLYVTVYDGHMQNNYRGTVEIGIDANGDSAYEIQKSETFDTTYSFPGEGGTGPVWLSDHMNRVTSDYLIWYDLTDAISGQTVNVQAITEKIDSSFDGRVKAMTLVVAYDDGDSDQVYYWVNQGHDTVNPLDDTYTGSTAFGTSTLTNGWNSANLTAIYLASVDGVYTFQGTTLESGVKSGAYYGSNNWDISSLLAAGQDSALAYNKQGENYFKLPLVLMSVRYSSASPALPVADFMATPTSGDAPLTVNFVDQSTGTPTSWTWDFDNDGTVDSTEQNPTYTYTVEGTYTVNLTVANAAGSDSKVKTDYIVVSTQETPDTTEPVINSVVLFPANTTAGSTITISVNATDDTEVTGVTAGDIQLTKTDDFWQGSITAPSAIGAYSLQITAKDAAGNTAETSIPYRVVQPSGGANIAVSPRSSSVAAGNTVSLSIKVKNTQNIDDTFKIRISVGELPDSYQADLSWFNWTEKVVILRAGEEVLIPIDVTVPEGTEAGRKLFRANANSETSSITGFDTGYLVIA